MTIRLVRPVPPSIALEFAGGRSFMRKALVHQCRRCEAVAMYDDETPLALAMLDQTRARRVEIAAVFAPAARTHMRSIIRATQLTLRGFAQNRILAWSRVSPANRLGQRLAMLIGMEPGRMRDPAIWIYRGDHK
jgi:hypothetical protein